MDDKISMWLGQYLRQWPLFDETILMISSSHLVKGAALCSILVYIWSHVPKGALDNGRAKQFDNRLTIIAALISSVFAEALALVLSKTLEFRLRPFLEPELQMDVPDRLLDFAASMSTGSSFPSDHAVLFAAMVTGIFMVSRSLGLFAALYSIVFIAFPRVYLGLHYTSDIVVGALIGVICAVAGVTLLRQVSLMRLPVQLTYSHQALIAPLSFLFVFQVATMLEDIRALAKVPSHAAASQEPQPRFVFHG
ncbi:MAG: phosphatase PAP2 family protein [Pseudomonadota bacterium]